MIPEAPPPRRHISSTPLSLSAASSILEKYLSDSETHPHLHPDAIITPEGVAFNAQGGAMGNPLMHHLRRVAAGMRGEYLEPERALDLEEEQQDVVAADDVSVSGGGGGDGKGKRGKKAAGADDEWQDLASYQAEQGEVEVGEVGDRTNVVREGGEVPRVQSTRDKDVRKRKNEQVEEQVPAAGKVDKEARKKAKKERDQQRKKDKAAKGKSTE